MDINEAIAIAKKEAKDPYAQSYLGGVPQAIEEGGEHGLRMQIPYILNNLQSWRGENARNAKAAMLAYLKKKK